MTQEADFDRLFKYRLLDEFGNLEDEASFSGDDIAIQWVRSRHPRLVTLGRLQRETVSGWVMIAF